MNPWSLLTTGHTIRRLKERPGAYKLLDKTIVPNFSGPKSPIPTTPHREPESALPVLQTALFEEPKPPLKDEVEPAPPVKVSPASALVASPIPVPARARPAMPVLVKETPPKPGLLKSLAGTMAVKMRQWAPANKTQPFQAPTIQTELALDRVKVLRNDLIEDDLEVVMLDRKTGKTEKPAPSERVEREKLTAHP